jgi:hypothetical protein
MTRGEIRWYSAINPDKSSWALADRVPVRCDKESCRTRAPPLYPAELWAAGSYSGRG